MKSIAKTCSAAAVLIAASALVPSAWAQSATGSGSTNSGTTMNDSAQGNVNTGNTTNNTTTAGAGTQQLNDSQIAMVVMAADTAEVSQAKMAATKAQNKQVKTFASHMAMDHSTNEHQVAQFDKKKKMTPEESQLSQTLTTQAQQTATQLQGMSGAQFDKAYMDAQVQQHQMVLDALNNQLIPNAQNAQLKTMLQKTAKKVAEHLEMAKKIQSSMSG